MPGIELRGIERAMEAVGAKGGQGTQGDRFSGVFTNQNEGVGTFEEFFNLKMEQIAEKQGEHGRPGE